MLHFGKLDIPTPIFVLAIAILVGGIQFLLAYKMKPGRLRWLPTVLFSVTTAILAVLIPFFEDWDMVAVIFLAICSAFALIVCIIGGVLGNHFNSAK